MKAEQIKELFAQFEATASEYEELSAGVPESSNICWDIPNGRISRRL